MSKRSNTVAEKMAELYALMATAAAKRAMAAIDKYDGTVAAREAEYWAEMTGKWMDKSSARAVSWTYSRPRT